MQGCRPLTDEEMKQVADSFTGKFALRDRAIFVTGVKTGFRISELLSLRVKDVWQFGRVVDRVTVARKNRKGKPSNHTVALNEEAQMALAAWLWEMAEKGQLQANGPLFRSRKGKRAITRRQALRVFRKSFDENQLDGPLGTHSLRKSFAAKAYEASGHDLLAVQRLLGHSKSTITERYLYTSRDKLDELVRAI